MKSQKIVHITIYISLLIFSFCILSTGNANAKVDAKKDRVRMKLYYSKNDAGERMFTIGLTAGSGKNMHGLKNGEVQLSSVLNDSTIVLAIVETDTSGIVKLYLDNDYILPMNEDGVTVIEASYEGNDVYRPASSDLEISDLEFDFSFEIEDSVKYLNVIATRLDKEGNKMPVEELGINIGIQRLYSVLPIDEVETDEDGIGVMEIPNDLPGDADGLLTFVARIEDHDEFGTVVKTASHTWGTPVSYEVKPLPRQLFTDEAPLWMISCVFIILLGAWYHFFLSISKLIKLKKSA
jgi:hypothetical protein